MKLRSTVHFLIGAVCVVALPSPILLATTTRGAAFLGGLLPSVPEALGSTIEAAAPPAPKTGAPAALAAALGPDLSPVFGPPPPPRVQIEALRSREIAVPVENVNSGESATFFIGPDGSTRAEQAAAIESFFRCRRTGRHKPLADGVLALLVDIAGRWPGRTIEVVSGYRSPPFGAPHSRHFAGHAIDLRVHGVRTRKVRDYIWRGHHEVGVGHYAEQDFVHVDSRPGQPDTAWSAPHEYSRPQYDPRWAKLARRAQRPRTLASLGSTAR